MLRPVFDQIKLLVGQKGRGRYCKEDWQAWHAKNLALHEHTVEARQYAHRIVDHLVADHVTDQEARSFVETDGEARDGTTSA